MDLLKPVKNEHAFILENGKTINSIPELKSMIHELDDNTFNHHVNSVRNDFSNWIRDIHNDTELADAIGKVSTKKDVANVINKHISNLMSPVKKPAAVVSRKNIKDMHPRKDVLVISMADEEDEEEYEKPVVKIKPKRYPVGMLTPKASLRENFLPFVKQNKIDYNQFKLKKNKKHKLDDVTNKDYMKMGAGDFIRGVVVGMIIGALLAMSVV